MPPAMMMSGQGQRLHGPMGGPPRMQGPPMQSGMHRAAPPRPMHQVSQMPDQCAGVSPAHRNILRNTESSPVCLCMSRGPSIMAVSIV